MLSEAALLEEGRGGEGDGGGAQALRSRHINNGKHFHTGMRRHRQIPLGVCVCNGGHRAKTPKGRGDDRRVRHTPQQKQKQGQICLTDTRTRRQTARPRRKEMARASPNHPLLARRARAERPPGPQ